MGTTDPNLVALGKAILERVKIYIQKLNFTVTLSPKTTLSPDHAKPQGTFGSIVGGLEPIFFEKDP